MKPSELKKEKVVSVRVNQKVFRILQSLGLTLQGIIDSFIDKTISIDIKAKREEDE